jgi:hypothetical protein
MSFIKCRPMNLHENSTYPVQIRFVKSPSVCYELHENVMSLTRAVFIIAPLIW